jgi:L,D-peptidoglycan transpeptidase YkuD (ErfK/YbiS/YcfS/YnhG family)
VTARRALVAAAALVGLTAACAPGPSGSSGSAGDEAIEAGPAAVATASAPVASTPPAQTGLFARTPAPAKPTPPRKPSPAAARPDNAAARLRTLPSSTRQVVVVSSDGYGTSQAVLETFEKRAGGWHPALGRMPARIGGAGFKDAKIEGDNATPTGMYGLGSTMYGIPADPGVKYAYHRLVQDDWWNENPASPGYNSFVHGPDPGGASEALWKTSPQYTYFAVITYNVPVRVADPPRGSGIFLHQMVPGRSTLGCVAVAQADLVRVLRWLDRAATPRIVMAPAAQLGRY